MQKRECKITRNAIIRVLLGVFDVLWVMLAAVGSWWMLTYLGYEKFQGNVGEYMPIVLIWGAINVVVVLTLCIVLRLYSMIFASVAIQEGIRVILVCAVTGVLNLVAALIVGKEFRSEYGIGCHVILMYTLLLLVGIMGSRFAKRGYMALKAEFLNLVTKKKRVLIVGCNNDAFTLIRHMVFNDKSSLHQSHFTDVLRKKR